MVSEPYSFATLNNRLMIKGNLVAVTALRIGSGRDTNVIGNDLPVLRDSLGAPFIPGASLKGAFRARVEALVRAVIQDNGISDFKQLEKLSRELSEISNRVKDEEQRRAPFDQAIQKITPELAALDFDQLEKRTQAVGQLKQTNRDLSDEQLSAIIWNHSTLIDLTFGSPEIAGRIFFKDALVDRSIWFDQFETRNGVALNRDTETAEEGLLYDYEVVPAGTRFDFELVLENAKEWQLGMILLALKPWERGEVQIGGFRSRGLGYVRLMGPGDSEHPEVRFTSVQTVDDVLRLLADGGGTEIDAAQAKQWCSAFIAVLKEPKLAHKEAANA
ncbi:MAG: CRISPR-associated RAMP protein Csx7 [Chloroflexales bacterium]|nr:CRISPR-associated RAMP protein Csx7 [Chloroflexales bacterium]